MTKEIPFAKWLDKELAARGLKKADFAVRIKMSAQHVSDVMNGARGVGPEFLTAIANEFGYPVAEVYEEAGLLPRTEDKDRWQKRMEFLLMDFTHEDDRRNLESIARVILENRRKK